MIKAQEAAREFLSTIGILCIGAWVLVLLAPGALFPQASDTFPRVEVVQFDHDAERGGFNWWVQPDDMGPPVGANWNVEVLGGGAQCTAAGQGIYETKSGPLFLSYGDFSDPESPACSNPEPGEYTATVILKQLLPNGQVHIVTVSITYWVTG